MPYRLTQCYLPRGSGEFPTFTLSGRWYSIERDRRESEGRRAELIWVVVIFQDSLPANPVTYLRNNQAVSWLGIEPVTKSHKPDVLTIKPPSHRISILLPGISFPSDPFYQRRVGSVGCRIGPLTLKVRRRQRPLNQVLFNESFCLFCTDAGRFLQWLFQFLCF